MRHSKPDIHEDIKISVSTLPVFDMVKFLDNEIAISEYLSQVLEDGDND